MHNKEVDSEGPPWNPKHDKIPSHWKHIGDGGNAYVWSTDKYAIKRLRPNASKEPVARFAREAKLMKELAKEPELALVEIVDVRKRAGELEIVMEKLEGNLAQVIDEFAGQPVKAAFTLLPIVETLARLATRPQSVHHRDIKPENLLYQRHDGKIQLSLSDFGCAYLAEDERLTPSHRAIGAWAYRPPEYNLGRVETVNEKGDVFSLGKVLWAMVNGQRHVVFPGPLWFLDEFDLAMKFPGVPKIHHTMVIIAQTCHIRSEARPTLDQLAANLRELTLSINKEVILTEPDLNARILQKEAQRDIEYQQRRAFAAKFVSAIHADLLSAIESLHRKLPQSSLFREWLNDSRVRGQTQEALINQVANQESDATVTFTFYQKTFLNTRIYPADANGPIRFVASVIDQSGSAGPSELTILDSSGELRADVRYSDGSSLSAPYQSNLIMDFLMNAASQLP